MNHVSDNWNVPGGQPGFVHALAKIRLGLRRVHGVRQGFPLSQALIGAAWAAGLGISFVSLRTGDELLIGIHNEHLTARGVVLAKAKVGHACGVPAHLGSTRTAASVDRVALASGIAIVPAAWYRDQVRRSTTTVSP